MDNYVIMSQRKTELSQSGSVILNLFWKWKIGNTSMYPNYRQMWKNT